VKDGQSLEARLLINNRSETVIDEDWFLESGAEHYVRRSDIPVDYFVLVENPQALEELAVFFFTEFTQACALLHCKFDTVIENEKIIATKFFHGRATLKRAGKFGHCIFIQNEPELFRADPV
jgi:hypothetical protein